MGTTKADAIRPFALMSPRRSSPISAGASQRPAGPPSGSSRIDRRACNSQRLRSSPGARCERCTSVQHKAELKDAKFPQPA
jgi:hypothetical protein